MSLRDINHPKFRKMCNVTCQLYPFKNSNEINSFFIMPFHIIWFSIWFVFGFFGLVLGSHPVAKVRNPFMVLVIKPVLFSGPSFTHYFKNEEHKKNK